MAINTVLLHGNIGQDIEFVNLGDSGAQVAKFSIAITERWKDKNSGEMREATEWARVEVFGNKINYVKAAMQKGTEVFVTGSMKTDTWTDNNGQKRSATKVVVRGPQHNIQVLSRGKPRDGAPNTSGPAQNTQMDDQMPGPDMNGMDDEIPF